MNTDEDDKIHMQNVFCKVCNDNVLESVMHNKMLKVLRKSLIFTLLHSVFAL